ncbi:MAG: CBS domain-containing protein [Methanocalculus sp.]|uniref:CBS domain-containing protein n=1 Tax=Methanocalculus sp. TaxID=2004547 RepID=UPI00272173E0|nr:CBS domain-containing protein [Methanocalculus sp.]MDO8840840.1 CBS domain-containing protein [Methanocalculus sp.]MDO9539075.1 CBS domain-containing protein [Methanocalculus sp.]
MDLSLIQKDILITLISLYHQHSHPIKGDDIAGIIKRNPGTVRNQMQALKALGLVDGIPGPKGGYHPTAQAYKELNIRPTDNEAEVTISKNGVPIEGIRVTEIDFTTLCHPDLCHSLIKIVGSVRDFMIGEEITIGPTPVNKLMIRGEVFGRDEIQGALLISISEMTSLPKKSIRYYMSAPLISIPPQTSIKKVIAICLEHRIHGVPIILNEELQGIVTLTDIIKAIDAGMPLDTEIRTIMTHDVIEAPANTRLYEVIRRFKEREIGRLIVVDEGRPIGILTQSDIIRVFPTL